MFTNSKVGQNFGKEIESKLKDATHLEIASGYFSYRLLDKLTPNLKKIAKRGSCKLLFGMIFHEKATKSQRDCITKLNNDLKKINSDSGVFLTIEQYHGKIFHIVGTNYQNIYIGSSNFSNSGFKTYREFNLQITNENDKIKVKNFLNYLFHEKDNSKKIGFPLESVDLQLKSQVQQKNLKKTLKNFKIPKDKFPTLVPKESLKIKHRPEVQPRSSLNLYFEKGRKIIKDSKILYTPRPWYEVEITSQKVEREHPWYPKGDWTAYVHQKVNGKSIYYKLNMVTSSGDPNSPKAIQSKDGRSILGELIKGKLERENFLKKYERVTQEILDSYGKDFIELKKINSGKYVMII